MTFLTRKTHIYDIIRRQCLFFDTDRKHLAIHMNIRIVLKTPQALYVYTYIVESFAQELTRYGISNDNQHS